ncbi:MAG: wax ester/triacylglycerol synthase family O-acyltransferase [Burkholderiales bacterium]|nr:wax ester/triacylglycerol synthase family O-acyltransferase [Burkholderiales bacterium]
MAHARQLGAQDARLLYSDTLHANANVTLVHIYDQGTVPGGTLRFKRVLERIEGRIAEQPTLRRKLRRVPLDLDYPYWVDDENFDLEYHVRHIALPRPGDWRQFCIQAARIHARPLDLARPLWEIYVVEGLDGLLELPAGSFALLVKIHQAAIDIEHGSDITRLLHDTEPSPPPPAPPPPWFPGRAPGTATLLWRGVGHTIARSVALAGPLARVARRAVPAARALVGDLLRAPPAQSVTRFNAVVSPHRVFETRRFGLDEFKTIRSLVPGATVNDVVLALCGGALRAYLARQDELPARSLSAMAPFHVRDRHEAHDATRRLAWARVDLGTDLADAVARLAHVQAQTASSELVARAVGVRELVADGHHVPAAMLALSAKLLGRATSSIGRRVPLASCTVTNVPGPSEPLYLCGARLAYFSALMPISDGMGLVFAVTSYDGRIVVSPTSCRELMPDPEVFAQCVRDSFQELLAAAQAARQRAGPSAPKRRASRRSNASGAPGAAAEPRAAASAARRRASPSGRRPPTNPAA